MRPGSEISGFESLNPNDWNEDDVASHLRVSTDYLFYREQQNRERGPVFGQKIENFLYITPKMCRPALKMVVLYKKKNL